MKWPRRSQNILDQPQPTELHELSRLESLPYELLAIVLDYVHHHSTFGVRPFSEASRTCRELAQPYKCEPRTAGLPQQWHSCTLDNLRDPVTLRAKEHYHRLIIKDAIPARPTLYPIQADLDLESALRQCRSYKHVELLIPQMETLFICISRSKTVFELASTNMPFISHLTISTIELSHHFMKDMTNPLHVRSRAVCSALLAFKALQHLRIHISLQGVSGETQEPTLLRPSQGCKAARDLYTFILTHKDGHRLQQIDLILSYYANDLFGLGGITHKQELSTTMTCRPIALLPTSTSYNTDAHTRNPQESGTYSTCSTPILTMILDLQADATRSVNLVYWRTKVGPYIWSVFERKWPNPSTIDVILVRAWTKRMTRFPDKRPPIVRMCWPGRE